MPQKMESILGDFVKKSLQEARWWVIGKFRRAPPSVVRMFANEFTLDVHSSAYAEGLEELATRFQLSRTIEQAHLWIGSRE